MFEKKLLTFEMTAMRKILEVGQMAKFAED